MKGHTKVDLEQLTKEIRTMKPRHKLYILLKRELGRLKHWRNLKRGDAVKGRIALLIKRSSVESTD